MAAPTIAPIAATSEQREQAALNAFVQKMPLKLKIGQMFMIGFQGTKIDEGLEESIRKLAPGGLIVFGRNITSARQISDLILNAQRFSAETSHVPLLVSTDQEGGDVIRIKTATPLPSALALGRAGNLKLVEDAGFATGRLLKTLGFNMDLAPVLDVANPRELSFIGTRTYGNDPGAVAAMGENFSYGLLKAGVLPTAKHFPGHGGVREDSHTSVPQKNVSTEELHAIDLVPFMNLQKRFQNKWAAMIGNVAYPQIDPSKDSALVSKPIVNDLLRRELEFDGIVLTDDIEMGGTGRIKDSRERVIRAIEAGADVIMVAWNKRLQTEFVQTVEKAVKSGRLSQTRIDESVRRILKAKRQFATGKHESPSNQDLIAALQNKQFAVIGTATIQARFARELEADEVALKTFAEDKQVLIFSSNQRFSISLRDSLAANRRARIFTLDPEKPVDINRVMNANPLAFGVFYVSGFEAAKLATKISDDVARRILLVTVETPAMMKNAAAFRYIADIYYRHPSVGKMVGERYFGVPLPIPPPQATPIN